MKKFVLITIGFEPPTSEIMESWMKWFKSIEDRILEKAGLSNGKEITSTGIEDLALDKNSITGYLVIEAANIEEAVQIAKECPMITSTKVYEVR